MGRVVTVTVDTNMLDGHSIGRIKAAALHREVAIDVRTVTVNARERGPASVVPTIAEVLVWNESRWGEGVWGGSGVLPEAYVVGETRIGEGVVAGDENLLEAILDVISNGSFPPAGRRAALSDGQLRQLRDAMTLEAHARERRDVFVTADVKGFVQFGRREKLEALCSTRIVAADEVGLIWPWARSLSSRAASGKRPYSRSPDGTVRRSWRPSSAGAASTCNGADLWSCA